MSSSTAGTGRHPSLPDLPLRRGVIPTTDLVITTDSLGSGRLGTVLRAEWLASSVAVKRIVPASEITSEVRAHLEREVSLLVSLLAHPNLLPLYGITSSPSGSIYLVTKLCAGGSLKARVYNLREAGAVMPPSEFFHVARSVASGLAFLHAGGLVYRDLKTGNVLLGADRERGTIQLDCEFGVIRFLLDQVAALHTRTSPATGHALDSAYVAPELLQGGDAAARVGGACGSSVDVYSFGMLLFEMVTGWPPFRALGMPELLKCLIARARPPMPPSVPSPVADLIAECCADEAADRPTARALLAKLCALEKQLAREGPAWPAAPAGVRDVTLSPPSVSIATGLPVPQPRAPAPSRAPFSLAAFSASAPGAL